MIGPYLRDLIDGHKPTTELNNNDDEHGEWKIQLVMQNKCISTKNFEDTCDVYSTRKPIEIFMGVDIDDTIDRLFDTLLQRFQKATETLNANGSGFTDENIALMYYNFMKKDIRRAESYVKSPNWIANKGATINPKNEKDNKCFQWSIISGLNYNKIKEKELKKLLKFKRVDTDFSSHQREWEEFEQNNTLITLNVLFVSYNSEEIKLAYKSRYNYKRKKHEILLLINDEAKNSYYFAVKNLLDLNSLGWLRGKKRAIINGLNIFQNVLNEALNYQTTETHPERISRIMPYIDK